MSLKDRIAGSVESFFAQLSDQDAMESLDTAAVKRELSARLAAKESNAKDAAARAIADLAATGAKARDARAKLAKERRQRLGDERKAKAAAKKRVNDEAYRRMEEEARRSRPASSYTRPSRNPGSTRGRSQSNRARNRPSRSAPKGMAGHYKTLGVGPEDDASTVKKAYRKLMRKYHPDLHPDPKKKKAATELTIKISAAYQAIEADLKKR